MSGAPFSSWDEQHRAASSVVAEAAGWASSIDQADDAAVLAWAREYLPRMLAHSERGVERPAVAR